MKEYYVYTHSIDGVVFYVGCGKIRPKKGISYTRRCMFERAYAIGKRSTYWKQYVSGRTVDVEIVRENLTETDAYDFESQLILKYGRLDLGTGTLVNKTDFSNYGNGRKELPIQVEQLDLQGNHVRTWDTVKSIQETMGWLKTNIIKCCRKKQITAYGFKWKYLNEGVFANIRVNAGKKGRTNANRPELLAIQRTRQCHIN